MSVKERTLKQRTLHSFTNAEIALEVALFKILSTFEDFPKLIAKLSDKLLLFFSLDQSS